MLRILFYKVYLNILSFLILYQFEYYKMILTFQFLGFTCLNPRGQIKKMLYVDFESRELLQRFEKMISITALKNSRSFKFMMLQRKEKLSIIFFCKITYKIIVCKHTYLNSSFSYFINPWHVILFKDNLFKIFLILIVISFHKTFSILSLLAMLIEYKCFLRIIDLKTFNAVVILFITSVILTGIPLE